MRAHSVFFTVNNFYRISDISARAAGFRRSGLASCGRVKATCVATDVNDELVVAKRSKLFRDIHAGTLLTVNLICVRYTSKNTRIQIAER